MSIITYDGSEIFQLCNSKTDIDIARCSKYILGVLDGRITYMSDRANLGGGEKYTLGRASCAYSSGDATVQGLGLAVQWQVEEDHQRYDNANGGITVIDAVNRATRFRCSGSPYAKIDNVPKLYLEGKELSQLCTSNNLSDTGACDAYLIGVLDGRKAYMSEYADVITADLTTLPELCIYSDPTASLLRLRAAVANQIKNDALRYNATYAGLASTDAIKVTFHCSK
ncbi:MAG: hypothetical protein NVS3B3_14710 [Aquirhabdus sp.]